MVEDGCLDWINRLDNPARKMETPLFNMLRCFLFFLEKQRRDQKNWICPYLDSSKEIWV